MRAGVTGHAQAALSVIDCGGDHLSVETHLAPNAGEARAATLSCTWAGETEAVMLPLVMFDDAGHPVPSEMAQDRLAGRIELVLTPAPAGPAIAIADDHALHVDLDSADFFEVIAMCLGSSQVRLLVTSGADDVVL